MGYSERGLFVTDTGKYPLFSGKVVSALHSIRSFVSGAFETGQEYLLPLANSRLQATVTVLKDKVLHFEVCGKMRVD